jgi:S-adenosylmethionine uptake transporter
MAQQRFIRGLLWFFLSLILGVGLDVLQKFLRRNLPSDEIIFFRFFFGTCSLLPLCLTRHITKTRYLWAHTVRGLLLFSGLICWCYGLSWVPISTAIALSYAIPLLTLPLSKVILNESVDRDRWLVTTIGLLGIWVVLNPLDMHFNFRALPILFSSFLFALLDVLNKKYAGRESTCNMLFYTAFFAWLLSGLSLGVRGFSPGPLPWALFLALGVGGNLLFFCLLRAFQAADISALSPFRYCDFLVSALFGFLFFAEKPTRATCLGFLIILPCTGYLAYRENRKTLPLSSPT